jgi:tetratricopeptide (TPR) repeat protein
VKIIVLITSITIVLLTFCANAQSIRETDYYPKLQPYINDLAKVKTDIAQQLSQEIRNPKDILVLDDKIEFKIKDQTTIINFADILDDSIKVKEFAVMNVTNIWGDKINDPAIANSVRRYLDTHVFLGNYDFIFKRSTYCKMLADNLFFIQTKLKEKRNESLIADFKTIAAQYCALKVKPPVSEEQRKYIVQANMFNQEKSYGKAIAIYKKVIELDQTAYPAAYSNLALLLAQLEKFGDAIFYMKKYLLLEPESADARSAQDKIYEWEAKIQK